MGSYKNSGERVSIKCEPALDKPGLVVTQVDAGTVGNVKLVDADKEKVFGVALMSTEDPLNKGTYLTNEYITVLKEGEVECILANDNAAIAVGDPIMAVKDSTAGTAKTGVVDLLTIRTDSAANYAADMDALVGFAKEAKAQNAGATYGSTIVVRLNLKSS